MNRQVPPYVGWPLLALFSYGVLYFWANRMIYYPHKHPQGLWHLQEQLRAADVWLTAGDGTKLHGWWVAVEGSRVATLFLHGNAGNVTHRVFSFQAITAAGSSVLVVDYRGYGRSEGSPSEKGLYADADAAYEYLLRQGYTPERIVIHGESLGSAVAVDLAARKACGALVLEAPFSSAAAVANTVLPLVGPLVVRSYDSKSKIGRVRAPLLVVHGDRDSVIPFRLGRELFDAAPEPKTFWRVDGADHNDLVDVAGEPYRKRLAEIYRRLS
ncbi:MAG: alpha/beta hydrolase [Bryobacteraceae bacterium]